MAKMKTFAVAIEVITKHTLFVEARRPDGAIKKLMSDEGWREAFVGSGPLRCHAKIVTVKAVQ